MIDPEEVPATREADEPKASAAPQAASTSSADLMRSMVAAGVTTSTAFGEVRVHNRSALFLRLTREAAGSLDYPSFADS